MKKLSIQEAQKDFNNLVFSCTKNGETIQISTKDGDVVMMNEKEYNNILETIYLSGIKGVREDIEEAINTPTSEFIKGTLF